MGHKSTVRDLRTPEPNLQAVSHVYPCGAEAKPGFIKRHLTEFGDKACH
jgi:hypothetical protein